MKTLIFGGSSGIGLAVAQKVLEKNGHVLLCSRSLSKLEKAQEYLRKNKGGVIRLRPFDFSKPNDVESISPWLVNQGLIPDTILFSGGGPPMGGMKTHSLKVWEEQTYEQFFSKIVILHHLLPHLKAPASIVFILSDVVRSAGEQKILPCSLRMALSGVMKCLSHEYAAYGIRFNALCPGPTNTPRAQELLYQGAQESKTSLEQFQNNFENELPLKRMASPEEIAHSVMFLFDTQSQYITGSHLFVDGGVTTFPL